MRQFERQGIAGEGLLSPLLPGADYHDVPNVCRREPKVLPEQTLGVGLNEQVGLDPGQGSRTKFERCGAEKTLQS